MHKPEVKFKQEPLRYICNEAFYGVKKLLPETIRESSSFDAGMAFILGIGSGYITAELGKEFAYPIIQETTSSLDIPTPSIDTLALTGLGLTSGLASAKIIAPKSVNEWRNKHPTYSSGVIGVMTGASIRALQELIL